MQRSLGIALALSALLVGGATWFRYANAQRVPAEISAIDVKGVSDEATDTISIDSVPLGPTMPAPKNGTELISQQIYSDYLNLSLSGQATEENITRLASVYATNIGNLHTSKKVLLTDIQITDDTAANYAVYAKLLTNIYTTYQTKLANQLGNNNEIKASGSAVVDFADSLQNIYEREATELKSIPVPKSVSSAHIRLINNYLSNASVFAALTKVDSDPASAYAGIVQQGKNSEEEKQIIAEIDRILTEHGL
jgi:hypothetical protein